MTKELVENSNISRSNKMINGRINLKAKSYDLLRSFASLVDFNDTDFHEYSLDVLDMGIDYKRSQSYIDDIMGNPLRIKDDRKQKYQSFSWMTSMTYENGCITAKLNPDLKPLMLELKENGNFTKTFEKYILPMNSLYAKRIYEMLLQNKDYGYRKFNLKELQEVLNVPKSMYKYMNFKAKILLIAIKEINKYTDIYIPVDTENLKDASWIKLQCGKTRKITHINFEFQNKSTASAPATKSQEPKEISAPSQSKTELLEKRFEELANNLSLLNYLDLPAEFEINEIDVELTKEFHKYISKQLFVFFQYCRDNNKNYKNLATSFKRHIRGAYKNNLDFFVTKEYLNRKEYENKLNEIKQIKEMEIYLEKHNNTNFEMILNDEKEQIFVINNKLFVSFEGNLLAINDKENMLKVVAYLKNI